MTAAVPAAAAPPPAPPATARHNAPLDGLRGLTAVSVLVFHVAYVSGASSRDPLGPLLSRIEVARAVLFVLSAYLLYQRFARSSLQRSAFPSVADFWWRRALRILPAYWVAMLVTVAVLLPHGLTVPRYLVSQLLVAQTVVPNTYPYAEMTQVWSLGVEVSFYLALPLLAVLFGLASRGARDPDAWLRRQLVCCAVMAAVGAAYVAAVHVVPVTTAIPVTLLLPYHLPQFAIGMAFAAYAVRRALPGSRPGLVEHLAASPVTWVPLLLVLAWFGSTGATGPRSTIDPTTAWPALTLQAYYGAFAAVAFVVVRWGPPTHLAAVVLASAPFQQLGRWSYGLYLWHMLALTLLVQAFDHQIYTGGFWALLVPTLLLSACAAEASVRWVERPTSRWRDLVTRCRRGGPPAVAGDAPVTAARPAAHRPVPGGS